MQQGIAQQARPRHVRISAGKKVRQEKQQPLPLFGQGAKSGEFICQNESSMRSASHSRTKNLQLIKLDGVLSVTGPAGDQGWRPSHIRYPCARPSLRIDRTPRIQHRLRRGRILSVAAEACNNCSASSRSGYSIQRTHGVTLHARALVWVRRWSKARQSQLLPCLSAPPPSVAALEPPQEMACSCIGSGGVSRASASVRCRGSIHRQERKSHCTLKQWK